MGRNWAITIGVNQYDNLQTLQYAKDDATSVRDFFKHEAGFEQVYFFTEDSPPIQDTRGPSIKSQPTFGTLKRFLRVRFEQPFLTTGDNFWFFFAGHGRQHEGQDYLMPMDADPGNIEETAIPVSFVTERLQRCGADNVILLLDACRSWSSRDGQGIGTELQKGVVTVFSCSPREKSYEIDELEHGSFTYALLEGLRLQGASNCATVERLDHHLRYQVPELNQQHQKPRQTPYTTIEPITKKHLILLPQQTTLLDDVKNLKLDAYEAEAQRNWFSARQLWTRVLAVSPADAQAIDGLMRVAVGLASTPSVPTPTSAEPAQARSSQEAPFENYAEDLGNGVALEMIAIPGGSFMMGSPETEAERYDREGPQHKVTVPKFFMGKFPVTQAQWRRVAALPQVKQDLEPDPSHFKGDSRPVEQVSWHDAVEFCDRLSRATGHKYRLPTEAEWEYACRAGTTTRYSFGDEITPELANYSGNVGETTDVGRYSPNPFGLYDVHGNVWEWCDDDWHNNYQNAPTDGSAWSSEQGSDKVRRGGAWVYVSRYCRSAFRLFYRSGDRYYYIGFRVCGAFPRILP
ncbi:MAG: SUMF1/EgtB/PvdO family nonheme iron enzyme [Microcoleaceae cyanobacterium]